MRLELKIFLATLVVVGVTIYQFTDWVSSELKPRYREAIEESLVDTSYLLANVLANSALHEPLNVEALRPALEELKAEKVQAQIYELEKDRVDLRISVTDEKGFVIFDSHEPQNIGRDFSSWRNIALTMQRKYGARTTRDNPDDPTSTVLYVSAPIKRNGGIIGVLTVAKPTQSTNYFIDSARGRLLKGSVTLLVFMLLFAALLIRYLARPIDKLTAYAHAIRDGKPAQLPKLASTDIAKLGQAFEEMKISLEGKQYIERYIQTLTHELKSPLAGIQGAAELLSEAELPEEKRNLFLGNILGESRRIHSLVERLLELSALEARGTVTSFETIDLKQLVDSIILTFLARLEQKRLRIQFDSPIQLLIEGNGFLIGQAVSNILDNAIDFSAPGGTLKARLDERVLDGRRGVEFSLLDEGPGIPEYAVGKLTEKFFSLPRPESGRKSSGLGLSIVLEVAKLHQGRLTIENRQGVDSGAEVKLWLPYSLADSFSLAV